MTVVVIGSGPAGVAAAQALTARGARVTVLDAGDRVEASHMGAFHELAKVEPSDWPSELLERVRGGFPVGLRNVPLKPAFGSLFPYALEDPDLPIVRENVDTLPSLARGGLSNTWGAAMLPFRQSDIDDWPISLDELGPHYEAVLKLVPIAAEHDELATILPLYSESPGSLRRSPQALMLLEHLRRHAPGLRAAGFMAGASRLALLTSEADPRHCRHGGLCLYGCPYESIYNASHTLATLVRNGNVDYRAGIYVDRLTRSDGAIDVEFHRRGDRGSIGQLTASRVFVACGAVSSTRLMLSSMTVSPSSRHLQDSQYFMVPMLTRRRAPVTVKTQGNTLAQVFIELSDLNISRHSVHLQVYGYNDVMLAAAAARLPLGVDRVERLLRGLLGRMVVVQGYLHSADSPGLTIHHDVGRVRLVGDDGASGAIRVKHLVRRLAAVGHLLGMLPVPGLLQVGRPGKGNHLGGSFPMRLHPGESETDTLGRLPGWDRVHLLDASIFPSIPATTITLSVMANAHRIATAAAEL